MKQATYRTLPVGTAFRGGATAAALFAMLAMSGCATREEMAGGGTSCAPPGASTVSGTLTTADPALTGEMYAGREPLYVDDYRLTAQAGETITATACGQLSGGEGIFVHQPVISFRRAGDPDRPAGALLADEGGTVTLTIPADGEYSIRIRSTHYGDTGPYTLSAIGGRNLRTEAQAREQDVAAAQEAQARAVQEKSQAAIAAGTAAEQRGDVRGALNLYLAALQANFRNPELWHAAINSALKIQPPPPIPEEARRHAVFGDTAVAQTKSGGTQGWGRAIDEYLEALKLAPWWADGWLFLSAAREEAGDFQGAHADLGLYLRAAPGGSQRDRVQLKMYELEFKAQGPKK